MNDFFDDLSDIGSIVDEAIMDISEPKKIDTKDVQKVAGIVSVAVPSFIYGAVRLIRYLRIRSAIREASRRKE